MSDEVQVGSFLSYERSTRLPDVKHTHLQLLNCEPQRWFVKLPNLGSSIRVMDLLGFGATSHLFEASDGEQQVMSNIAMPMKLLLFPSIALHSEHWIFATHRTHIAFLKGAETMAQTKHLSCNSMQVCLCL